MKKTLIIPLSDRIVTSVAELLRVQEGRHDYILSDAICPRCGLSWRLWITENAQFTHHRCPGHRRGTKRYVVRVNIEEIGDTQSERDELAAERRRALRQ
jgi:hypothetical protein